jgi:hypothetical protein
MRAKSLFILAVATSALALATPVASAAVSAGAPTRPTATTSILDNWWDPPNCPPECGKGMTKPPSADSFHPGL